MTAVNAASTSGAEAVGFTPELRAEDPLAAHWLLQATLRLRREVAWRWHLAEGPAAPVERDALQLPPPADPLQQSLDLTRHAALKQRFFESDPTARFLSGRLAAAEPLVEEPGRGGFAWAARALALDEPSRFALGLALLAVVDPAAGAVIQACGGAPGSLSGRPTLALAARLWPEGLAFAALADPQHPLRRSGLLPLAAEEEGAPWEAPLQLPALLAETLLQPGGAAPACLPPLEARPLRPAAESRLLLESLGEPERLAILPLTGLAGADFAGRAAGIAALRDRPLSRLESATPAALTLAWLLGHDLFIESGGDPQRFAALLAAAQGLPLLVILAAPEPELLKALPRRSLLPAQAIAPLDLEGRQAAWRAALGERAETLEPGLSDCVRRYRFEGGVIAKLARRLNGLDRPAEAADLAALCRAEAAQPAGEMGALAERIEPRFGPEDLVLPPGPRRQFEELLQAMRGLGAVQGDWGAAKAWGEVGLSVLFAGAPGTGKTLAAEVLAGSLGLPLYRIDLSQIVNKYIGETEKNLKRVFDQAEVADSILFFDEADALFGRRSEVKDAHDRYANLEISYLLQRMERFKGLAILASNRRKDLDEAFLRRLRDIIEFPMPDEKERRAIWLAALPPGADASELDFDLLAHAFPLAGGHIRSILFNACLQAAARDGDDPKAGARRRLGMAEVVVAVKREYDKLGRSVSLSQFGPYAPLVEGLKP